MISPFVRPVRRPVRRTVAGIACVALIAAIAGCTNQTDSPQPTQSADATGTAPTLAAKPVPMTVRVTRVSGKLKKSTLRSLEHNIGRTIGGYWDAAYLGGKYPRRNFDNAFSTFTSGAEQQARQDRAFTTNAGLGASTEAVAPKQKQAWVSVLAPHKVAAGVTARIHLVYLVDRGEATWKRVTISGRLLLTKKKSGGWQIFGYDVARSASPVQKGASR